MKNLSNGGLAGAIIGGLLMSIYWTTGIENLPPVTATLTMMGIGAILGLIVKLFLHSRKKSA